jgi:hypothetical protein
MVVAWVLVDAPETAAQQERATGSVAGVVVDGEGRLLASAWVAVAGSRRGSLTQEDGQFSIHGLARGPASVEVALIGYRSATVHFVVEGGRTSFVRVALDTQPVQLDPLEGSARGRLSPELRGFYDRRDRGRGHFFTPEEIERIRPRLVTDLLRRVPNLRIEPGTGTQGPAESVRTQRATGIAGGRACSMLYYVNGMPFNIAAGTTINAYIRPNEIAGIEVYMGASQIPPQFHLSQNNARCGLVVIWTHSGERWRME